MRDAKVTRPDRLGFNLLLLLDGLFKEQNLSAVARQLGMSQPMASAGLRTLREFFGEYPSLATQQALRKIADAVPETPVFHWSDIDPDGTWIFHTIERAIGRFIRPHLMSIDIAEKFGKSPPTKGTSARCPEESGIFSLAEYLTKDGAKMLEQEELDPQIPSMGA